MSTAAGLYWDAAAFPGGQALADAAGTVLTALNAAAVTARWDAWTGAQSRRPRHEPASPAGQAAAARLLISAAQRLLATTQPQGSEVLEDSKSR